MTMADRTNNWTTDPCGRRTTAQLQAIARGLRERATKGRYGGAELSREIARVERLIAARETGRRHGDLAEPADRRRRPRGQ